MLTYLEIDFMDVSVPRNLEDFIKTKVFGRNNYACEYLDGIFNSFCIASEQGSSFNLDCEGVIGHFNFGHNWGELGHYYIFNRRVSKEVFDRTTEEINKVAYANTLELDGKFYVYHPNGELFMPPSKTLEELKNYLKTLDVWDERMFMIITYNQYDYDKPYEHPEIFRRYIFWTEALNVDSTGSGFCNTRCVETHGNFNEGCKYVNGHINIGCESITGHLNVDIRSLEGYYVFNQKVSQEVYNEVTEILDKVEVATGLIHNGCYYFLRRDVYSPEVEAIRDKLKHLSIYNEDLFNIIFYKTKNVSEILNTK